MSADTESPVLRLFAMAVYAPIGLGAWIVDDAPAAADRARQQVRLARFLGKMAVDQGIREVQRRLDTSVVIDTEATSPAPTGTRTPVSVSADPEPDEVSVPDADTLALPDYDVLAASQILGKLGRLTQGELADIERYERAHRRRSTVLGKIEQLQTAHT